jgi:hypothetical protein
VPKSIALFAVRNLGICVFVLFGTKIALSQSISVAVSPASRSRGAGADTAIYCHRDRRRQFSRDMVNQSGKCGVD